MRAMSACRIFRRPSRAEIAAATRYYEAMRIHDDGEPPGTGNETAAGAGTEAAEKTTERRTKGYASARQGGRGRT
jgi:hypothetical protein